MRHDVLMEWVEYNNLSWLRWVVLKVRYVYVYVYVVCCKKERAKRVCIRYLTRTVL